MEKSLLQKAVRSSPRLLVAFLTVAILCGTAAGDGIGGSSGAFLRLPVGAAAVAMGGAGIASPAYFAAWWNPASPSLLRDHRIAGGTGVRSLGRMDAYGAFDIRVPQRMGLGIFALYRGDPALGTLYDLDEQKLPDASYTTMTIKTALSYLITRRLSAGIAINILHQRLPTYGESDIIDYATATGIGSFDLALSYTASDRLKCAAVLKNIGAVMEWQMGSFSPMVEDRPLPALALGSSYSATLAGKPFIWACDLSAYALDGKGATIDRSEIVLCTGVEWQGWDNFRVRTGMGDFSFTSDLVRTSTASTGDKIGGQFTLGFAYRPVKKQNSLWINYAAATDKVWAGVDQQLDVCFAF